MGICCTRFKKVPSFPAFQNNSTLQRTGRTFLSLQTNLNSRNIHVLRGVVSMDARIAHICFALGARILAPTICALRGGKHTCKSTAPGIWMDSTHSSSKPPKISFRISASFLPWMGNLQPRGSGCKSEGRNRLRREKRMASRTESSIERGARTHRFCGCSTRGRDRLFLLRCF